MVNPRRENHSSSIVSAPATFPVTTTNPDPSAVTSEAIDRRVVNSEKVISARLDGMEKAVEVFQADLTRVPTLTDRAILGLREILEARLDGIIGDMEGVHKNLDMRNGDIKEQIDHLRGLLFSKIEELSSVTTERFAGVAAQFSERDTRTDQRAGDTKLAVDAAFAAAKEATSKIEAGFTKSIDGQQELLKTTTKSTDEKISDMKDRITAIENRTVGITTANGDNRNTNNDNRNASNDSSSRFLSLVAIAVAAAVGLAEVLTRLH